MRVSARVLVSDQQAGKESRLLTKHAWDDGSVRCVLVSDQQAGKESRMKDQCIPVALLYESHFKTTSVLVTLAYKIRGA